jgi:hypothetical protein
MRSVKHSFDFRWEPAPPADIVPPQRRCSLAGMVARGATVPEGAGPVSSHLRFITAASLIVFGGMIGVGAVALLPTTADRTLLASAASSDLPATPCKQSGLPFDRSCLTKRDLPWTAGRGAAVTSEAPPDADNATKPPSTEGQRVATAPQAEPPQPAVVQASVPQASPTQVPGPQASVPQAAAPQPVVPQALTPQALTPQALTPQASTPQASTPQASTPQASTPQASTPPAAARPALAALPQEPTPQASAPPKAVQRNLATPAAKPPVQRPAAKERHAAKPAIEENEDTRPAQKKAFRPERTAKRPTNDALNAVRKFGDSPREIPATSYAADGTRRDIVIRPTSIQDVYYYSAPR